jgi:hypothetical protein
MEAKVTVTVGEIEEGWRIDAYLSSRWRALVNGESTADCQDCRGCCRNGFVIGLSRKEADRIPHTKIGKYAVLMPLDDGRCPFLKAGNCSIYDYRPQTCRDYDCRDYAMAGQVVTDGPANVEINTSIVRHLKNNRYRVIGPYARYVREHMELDQWSKETALHRGLAGAIADRMLPEHSKALLCKAGSAEARQRDRAATVGVREHSKRGSAIPDRIERPCNGPANGGPANAQ